MVLLCLADIHGNGKGLEQVLAVNPEADAILIAGDVTHLGGYAEAESVLRPVLATGRRVLAVAGNMDGEGARRYLRDRGIDIHGLGVTLGDVGFQGLGGSNPAPFSTPFVVTSDEAVKLLAAGLVSIAGCGLKVLVSHAPPKGTKLDRTAIGLHVGSPDVREFILKNTPRLCICGHIHEALGEDELGETLCVNVGPYKGGSYVLVKVEGRDVFVLRRKI